MNKNQQQISQIKEAIAAAFRAISGNEKDEVIFVSHFETSPSGHKSLSPNYSNARKILSVPFPEPTSTPKIKIISGYVDAEAMILRFHKPGLHELLRADDNAGLLLDELERVRVEALGSVHFKGAAKNIAEKYKHELRVKGYHTPEGAKTITVPEVVAVFARDAIYGKSPKEAKEIIKIWESHIRANLDPLLKTLAENINDQEIFAGLVNKIAELLRFGGSSSSESGEDMDAVASKLSDQEEKDSEADQTLHSGADAKSVTGEEQPAGQDEGDLHGDVKDDKGGKEEAQEKTRDAEIIPFPKSHPYAPYTTKFDEIVSADKLSTPQELAQLRSQLDQRLSMIRDITRKLAIRLQRKLQSQQVRGWKFHTEEGILDPNKLTHIIINPMYETPYKYEKETSEVNTVVSLLIDNSGSMRGRPITVAALSTDILARTLERCGIKVEILGFTTKEWKGGQSRKLWAINGSPVMPGRLNDLLHIIYKQADTPWRVARRNLGLMLKEGILKENIDGEALLWAHERLLARPEKRKILMVISDGAPVDDSTLSVNSAHFMEVHLKETIHAIEDYSDVELLAIGIGHDVTTYYKNAVTLSNAEQLSDTMINKISELFETDKVRSSKLKVRS